MRLLLDESLPKKLREALPGHSVATVVELGWGGTKNGALLAMASARFDAFLTADQNLEHQQNREALSLAVLVLCANSTELASLLSLVPQILTELEKLEPNTLVRVEGAA